MELVPNDPNCIFVQKKYVQIISCNFNSLVFQCLFCHLHTNEVKLTCSNYRYIKPVYLDYQCKNICITLVIKHCTTFQSLLKSMDLHVYTGLHSVIKIELIHKKPKELIHVLYYVSISESTVQLVISMVTCIWMWRHAPMAHHSRSPWPHLRPWAIATWSWRSLQ